MVIGGYPPAQG